MINERSDMLANENIKKLIYRMSTPAIVGLLVQAFYNLVDTIFVGRGLGADSSLGIAGISVAFPVQMLMMGISMGLGIGGASIISRALGMGDRKKAEKALGNMVILVIISSVIFTILGLVFIDPVLKVFGASESILPFAREYTKYILMGTIFFAFSAALSNTIRAEGHAKFAMSIMLISSIVNIILDPLFIFEFNMGIMGAAVATVISQIVGCVLVLHYYTSNISLIPFRLADMVPDLALSWETVSIGMSEFIFNSVESLVFILLNQSLLVYGGDMAIAVFGIIIKVFMLTLMPIIGIKHGIQPIFGFNYGAGNLERVRETVSISNYIVFGMCILSVIVVFLIPEQIFRVFSTDAGLIDVGVPAIKISFLMMPFIGTQVVAMALLQSLGKSKGSLMITLSRQIFFLPPLVFILPLYMGLTGIWVSFPISDFLGFVVAVILMKKEVSKLVVSVPQGES
ncbi:putative efflux protein, MATE family [Methanolobus tindarius DSM 2278]|uniref:Multidrug export protein MepA n=1 Tax=Methanolobus tindarius DSM 2278 TaxID=1090322 RepID=W9DTE7_METTI|nr:MATE family efflux transporter [Methanolobus tindarius]ETA69043.1 putative efflux protein, MATE family [Methanolobus tindarius DSM 2278]